MKRIIVPCSISLSFLKHKNPLVENMTVEGDLSLCGSTIETIPNGLIVTGSLDLSYTNVTKLPDDLIVGDWVYLHGTNITRLPDKLKVRPIYKDF